MTDAIGARGLGRVMSRRHSGQIQTYLGAIAVGMLGAAASLRMADLITALILIPLLGALFVSVARQNACPRHRSRLQRAHCDYSRCVLWRNFDTAAAGLQMVERQAWIPAIGAEYLVGVDGLSLLLVFLTSLIFPFALLAQRMGRGFCALMLVMQAALYGTFTAQNFVLWFLFYEMSLIPAFLLIKIWGGENRDRAATKFFRLHFSRAASRCCSRFSGFISLGEHSISPRSPTLGKAGLLTGNIAWLAFAGIFLGLAVKVPLFPVSHLAARCLRSARRPASRWC